MDDALVHALDLKAKADGAAVLILVLMDDALVRKKANSEVAQRFQS